MAKIESNTRPKGRPAAYTEELAAEIVDRHSNGETLATICRNDTMPHVRTVLRWAASMPLFGKRYAMARLLFADAVFDQALAIADDQKSPPRRSAQKVADVAASKAEVARDRLRVDVRLRIVSKINPAKYGDRMSLHHSGEITLSGVSDAELNSRIRHRLEELGVIHLLKTFSLTAEQLEEFLELFRVIELPTAAAPLRLLPGETELPSI